MLRVGAKAALVCAALFCGAAQAAGPGAPLQLAPGNAGPGPLPSAKLPANWKLLVRPPEALTGEVRRQVITVAKVMPVIDGKPVSTGLAMQCTTDLRGKKTPTPQVAIVLLSLTGISHFKKFSARYRFDEGPVHQFVAEASIGRNHDRAIALPQALKMPDVAGLAKLPALDQEIDPGVEIAGATRLRVEFNFMSAGVTFLDFNVSGATQAINALGCE